MVWTPYQFLHLPSTSRFTKVFFSIQTPSCFCGTAESSVNDPPSNGASERSGPAISCFEEWLKGTFTGTHDWGKKNIVWCSFSFHQTKQLIPKKIPIESNWLVTSKKKHMTKKRYLAGPGQSYPDRPWNWVLQHFLIGWQCTDLSESSAWLFQQRLFSRENHHPRVLRWVGSAFRMFEASKFHPPR